MVQRSEEEGERLKKSDEKQYRSMLQLKVIKNGWGFVTEEREKEEDEEEKEKEEREYIKSKRRTRKIENSKM